MLHFITKTFKETKKLSDDLYHCVLSSGNEQGLSSLPPQFLLPRYKAKSKG